MVVGEYSRDNDLDVNLTKEKKLTNMRASGHDEATIITPPREMDLDAALEWIAEDELVEVTPENVRMRKKVLQEGHARREVGGVGGRVSRAPPVTRFSRVALERRPHVALELGVGHAERLAERGVDRRRRVAIASSRRRTL